MNTTVKFPSGQIVATPGALSAMQAHDIAPVTLLRRHLSGDWGDVPDDDAKLNDASVLEDGRILSSYNISAGVTIWLITEWDRSATTFLLPSEY